MSTMIRLVNEQSKTCTCVLSEVCRSRGCHVLLGPVWLGYKRPIRGLTVCLDCPLGEVNGTHDE